MKKMYRYLFLIFTIAFIATACSNYQKKNENNNLTPLTPLAAKELYDFELIRGDWTETQFQELGMQKKTNLADEIIYYNEFIEYVFLDSETPTAVMVFGISDIKGPRGIAVGSTFDEVLALFPQDHDWKKSSFGEFYGKVYETEEFEPMGRVSTYNDTKRITLAPEEIYPFIQINFKNDIVQNYVIYLIDVH